MSKDIGVFLKKSRYILHSLLYIAVGIIGFLFGFMPSLIIGMDSGSLFLYHVATFVSILLPMIWVDAVLWLVWKIKPKRKLELLVAILMFILINVDFYLWAHR